MLPRTSTIAVALIPTIPKIQEFLDFASNYETDDEAVLKEKEEQIRLFSLFKVALNPAIWPNASAQAVEAFVDTVRNRLFPLLEKNY